MSAVSGPNALTRMSAQLCRRVSYVNGDAFTCCKSYFHSVSSTCEILLNSVLQPAELYILQFMNSNL